MSNYSGTKEEQLEKRRAYDKARQSTPEYREAQRLRRQTPEAKRRDTMLKQTFGMSLDDYNTMLAAQGGVCYICHDIDPARSLAVDHCHETGKVRGLLCRNCNQGVGLLRDDTVRLARAIEYLNVHCDHSN